MKRSTFILGGLWVLVVILMLFNAKINSLGTSFEKDCSIQYDVDGPCPCVTKTNNNMLITSNLSKNWSLVADSLQD